MTRRSSFFQMTALAVGLTAGLSATAALAAQEEPADVTGTWKWTTQFQDRTFETTLKLKQEEGTLTGTISGRADDQATPIEEGKVEEDKVSFQVTREREGNKFVQKYQGTVKGDTITGQIEMQFGDETRTRDWEAKRAEE